MDFRNKKLNFRNKTRDRDFRIVLVIKTFLFLS